MVVSFHLFYLKESNSTNSFTNVNEYIFIHLWYGRYIHVYIIISVMFSHYMTIKPFQRVRFHNAIKHCILFNVTVILKNRNRLLRESFLI